MARAWPGLLVLMALAAAGAVQLEGIYVGAETRMVPVARLVSNLEKQLTSAPRNADIHLRLARLYGMAYSLNTTEVPVFTKSDGSEEVWFGHEPKLVVHSRIAAPEAPRTEAAKAFLKQALVHYRSAIELDPQNLIARLGYGWCLEVSGDKDGAIAAYRLVIERAWSKEKDVRVAELGQRFYVAEAAEYLIPLLDPKRDAQEIAELNRRRGQMPPRPITPIAIPMQDGTDARAIVDLDAQVAFDADGSGLSRRWTWISPAAGWLVYDATGRGQIASALQLFGDVTFWLMWKNGYEALSALDDDGDGELKGTELRYLAIWHDRESNGISDAGEVRPLAHHQIVAVSCRFTRADGVFAVASSEFGVRLNDGRVRPTFDVILRPARSVSPPTADLGRLTSPAALVPLRSQSR